MDDVRLISPSCRILLTLGCTLSIILLSLYLFCSPFGFDFTDEGFYFNWYKFPDSYPATVTFFGFIYAFPYRLFGENIIALRIFNIISVFVAGAWCVDQVFAGSSKISGYIVRPATRFAFAFSLSGLSLLGLGRFTSPSYNHLALIGCFLVAGALLRIGPLADGNKIRTDFSFGIPLVVGIGLAFLGKPTTGIVLWVICLAYALLSKRSSRALILLSLILSAILSIAVAAIFNGGISALLAKSMLGKQWISILDGGHDNKGLFKSVIQVAFYPPFLPFAFILILQERIVSSLSKLSDKDSHSCSFISAIILSVAFLFLLSPSASSLESTSTAIWFLGMTFIFAHLTLRAASLDPGKVLRAVPIRSISGASRLFLILLIPFGYGFGTNTDIWSKALSASLIFVCFAAYLLVQLPPRSMKSALSGFLLCYLIGAVMITPSHASFFLEPYRQPQPLFLNTFVTRIGKASQLRLTSGFSNYIQSARSALVRNGFKPGDSILDLTGQSPGLIYAVEGRAIGQAWLIGGYKGSNLLGKNAIAKIPCRDLHSAWIIVEPGGPISLDLSLLESFGINIKDPSQYKKVTDLSVPLGAGGYKIVRNQVIYKPVSDANISLKCS